jgi:high affinity sulfate transporter 1
MRGQQAGSVKAVRWLPALEWLRRCRSHLRADLIAGITLAAYLVPASLGDASLAGLPPQAGLYACLFAGLVFWALCSSRQTAITVTSAISLLLGTSLGDLAGGDPARLAALAAGTAILVAGFAFVAWAVRAGAIVNFISESVLVGWKVGVALYLGSTQLPKLCGFHGSHGDFWERSSHFLSHSSETNATSLTLGGSAVALLLLGKRFLPNKPIALGIVVLGIATALLVDLGARGVDLLGIVPKGLPPIGPPTLALADWNTILPLAIACFLLSAVETAAIGRMFAAKHHGRLDSNQELLALAGANLAAGLGAGFPVSGGMSQSLVNESGGAQSPLSGLFAALLTLTVALFLSGLLAHLPQPVLAAIVLVAVFGLVNVAALKHLWRSDRGEFAVAMIALLGVLGSGLLRGVLIGAIVSIVRLLHRASRPHVAFLGRIPGTRRFSDAARNPENEFVADVLIVRPESSLLYFNCDHVKDRVLARFQAGSPKLVLCDLSASPHIDLAGCQMLSDLAQEILAANGKLQLVEARASVRDTLRREGIEQRVGRVDRFSSVADAVDAFLGAQPTA